MQNLIDRLFLLWNTASVRQLFAPDQYISKTRGFQNISCFALMIRNTKPSLEQGWYSARNKSHLRNQGRSIVHCEQHPFRWFIPYSLILLFFSLPCNSWVAEDRNFIFFTFGIIPQCFKLNSIIRFLYTMLFCDKYVIILEQLLDFKVNAKFKFQVKKILTSTPIISQMLPEKCPALKHFHTFLLEPPKL